MDLDILKEDACKLADNVVMFSGEIGQKEIDDLIINVEAAKGKYAEGVVVHFTSPGGNLDQMERAIHYFDNIGEDVKFVFHNQISSAAFEFAVRVKAFEKKVLKYTIANLHIATATLDYREHVVNKDGNHYINATEKINKEMANFFYSLGIPEADIQDMIHGKHVYMYDDELKRIIEDGGKKEEDIQEETA